MIPGYQDTGKDTRIPGYRILYTGYYDKKKEKTISYIKESTAPGLLLCIMMLSPENNCSLVAEQLEPPTYYFKQ